jgi:transposase
MYIELVPNRNSPPAVLLRESFREEGKVKKRTLANLSKLPSHVVDSIKLALTGSAAPASSQFTAPECGPIYGSLFALNKIAEDLQFGKVFGPSREGQLTKLLVLARIAHQGSRLSTVRWAKDHAVKEVLGIGAFDEDDLYKALDWAAENQDRIENRLFKQYVKKCGQPPTLILYDVTSSYFEGEQNELSAYGYNRDGKKGKKQIVIGLLAAQDGEPLSVQVFKGNTSDPQTVSDQIEKLTKRFEVKEIVFVGDRGMVKAKANNLLKVDGFKYITAITDPQIRSLIKGKVIQPTLFDKTVVEVESMGKRYIMRRDELTFRKEQHRRQDKLERLETKVKEANLKLETSKRASLQSNLNQLGSWVRKYKISKFIRLETKENSIAYTIDQDSKADDELLDGCYVIETNVVPSTLDTQKVHDHYKDLQKVERDFRTMKTGLLEVRPIFLRNKGRTMGHVFISMLALKITRQMEQSLHSTLGTAEKGGETIESTLSALSRICLLKYTVAGQELTVLPKTDVRQTKILGALKIDLAPPGQCTQ